MEILPNISIIGLALHFDSVLVISDVHIGYEESLNRQGILVPRTQFGDIAKSIGDLFEKLGSGRVQTIVVNGDLKHEFGTVSEQEWRNVLKFIDLLASRCNSLVLIKGNHDAILEPIAKKRNVQVAEYYKAKLSPDSLKSILITHGNKLPGREALKKVDTIIIGHEHPAISIKEGPRIEKFKCFLKGKYKGLNLIVQPSFNTMIEGTDVMKDDSMGPFLPKDMGDFEVFAVEDKTYYFGKLGSFKTKYF